MSNLSPYEIIEPTVSQPTTPTNSSNTTLKVLLVILLLLFVCCCCCMLVFLAIWGGFAWLWNNGDSIFYGSSLFSLLAL
jgi:hypothetical protein